MYAIILAAGKGVRMLPLTKYIPKPLVKINKKPLIQYLIENCLYAGINKFGFVLGYKAGMVSKFLQDFGIDYETFLQTEQKGTAHALMCVEQLDLKEFLVLMGDSIYSPYDLRNMIKHKGMCILCYKRDDWYRYGVVETNKNILVRIHEKPKRFISNLVNTGAYKFNRNIFDVIKYVKLSERGEYELTDAVNILASKKCIEIIEVEDYCLEIGNSSDIKYAEIFFKNRTKNKI